MDTTLIEIFKQAPLVALVIYIWRLSIQERASWQTGVDQIVKRLEDVISRNTEALEKNAMAFGEFIIKSQSLTVDSPFPKKANGGLQ